MDAQIGHQDKPAEKGQKTTVLIEVPVSGRLGYLITADAWVHYSFSRIIMTQKKTAPVELGSRSRPWGRKPIFQVDRVSTEEIISPMIADVIILEKEQ